MEKVMTMDGIALDYPSVADAYKRSVAEQGHLEGWCHPEGCFQEIIGASAALTAVLQEQDFERVGGTRTIGVNVRPVAGDQPGSGAGGISRDVLQRSLLPVARVSHSRPAPA
jgi:hypothetical protein